MVPRTVSRLVFVVVLCSCAYFVQGGGMNENSRYALVRALVDDHTVRIDRYADTTIDRSQFEGHAYSDKAPGLALLAAVPYLVVAGYAQDHAASEPSPLALHLITVATCALASAFAAVILLHLLVGIGLGIAPALLAVLGWTLGTCAFGYATMFYAHQLVAALLVIGLAGVRAATPRALFGAGLATGFAVLAEYPAVLLAVGLLAYGLATLGGRRMTAFAIGAAIPAAVLAVYNTACFGGPLHLGYQSLANPEFAAAIDRDLLGFGAPSARVLGELLVFQYRGLLPLSPFLVLAPLGMWQLIRTHRGLGILCTTAFAGFVVVMSGYHYWDGGAAMGPRLIVPALPFAIIPVAVAIDRLRRPGAIVGAVLVASSIAICTMVVAVGPELPVVDLVPSPWPDLASPDRMHPITSMVAPLFVRGQLSQKATLRGRIRYSSEYPGHDADAYNVGEALGLRGLPSLVPLLAVWLVCGVAIGRTLRRKP